MRHLDLWKHHLGEVPPYVWENKDLETLVLADNDLTQISAAIGGLTRLRMLDLGHNQLRELPAALGDLVNLSDFLYLHDNELSSLPESLRGLKRLRYLNISENEFRELPFAICDLTGLIELRASDNRLTSIPDQIGSMTSWPRFPKR
jgi:Leucine-rich repeat (LRR) protein